MTPEDKAAISSYIRDIKYYLEKMELRLNSTKMELPEPDPHAEFLRPELNYKGCKCGSCLQGLT